MTQKEEFDHPLILLPLCVHWINRKIVGLFPILIVFSLEVAKYSYDDITSKNGDNLKGKS